MENYNKFFSYQQLLYKSMDICEMIKRKLLNDMKQIWLRALSANEELTTIQLVTSSYCKEYI